jgi:hypothetical protein
MNRPAFDDRSHDRRARDEQIAAEAPLAPLELPSGALGSPMEKHLAQRQRRPLAVLGIVENGLVRPLDPAVRLTENSRVIIVAAKE